MAHLNRFLVALAAGGIGVAKLAVHHSPVHPNLDTPCVNTVGIMGSDSLIHAACGSTFDNGALVGLFFLCVGVAVFAFWHQIVHALEHAFSGERHQ
jgi:hypothetical protein